MQNRYDGSTPLSFLFLGYREKRWYYEFIIMGKKAGLILLSVFLKNYPRYQIIGASLLVQISFFLHVFLRPYDTITSYGMICNKLESISLLSLVMKKRAYWVNVLNSLKLVPNPLSKSKKM